MITLNAKEYLNRVRFADRLINVKDKELHRLRLSITQMSPQTNGDRVKSSNTTDFTQTVDKIVDLQNEINSEIDDLICMKNDVRSKINGLDDAIYILVLTEYYLNCETFEKTAETIGCSDRWIRALHGKALQAFRKKYNMD